MTESLGGGSLPCSGPPDQIAHPMQEGIQVPHRHVVSQSKPETAIPLGIDVVVDDGSFQDHALGEVLGQLVDRIGRVQLNQLEAAPCPEVEVGDLTLLAIPRHRPNPDPSSSRRRQPNRVVKPSPGI